MVHVWPNNKRFAFTIIDDTDGATTDNIKPVYDLLVSLEIKATKTVWVYPPKDMFKGQCLLDEDYMNFILWLRDKGFEIAFHGAGSGNYTRKEVLDSLEVFNDIIGYYPKIHINHGYNPDSMYWGKKRFTLPFGILYKSFTSRDKTYHGDEELSDYFWGDACKEKIKYIRNRVFSGIDTIKYDRYMPYIEKKKEKYSNLWFSASNGNNVNTFCDITCKKNIDHLSDVGGCCILYTHFAYGFVDESGRLSGRFVENMKYLAGKNGWFASVGEVLDYIHANRRRNAHIPMAANLKLDAIWLMERMYRKLFMSE